MKNKLNFLFILISISIYSQNNYITEKNKIEYTKKYIGELSTSDSFILVKEIEKEFNVSIPLNKNIIIHYSNRKYNCIGYNFSENGFYDIPERIINISNNLEKKYKLISLYSYSSISRFKNVFENITKYKLASDFINEVIFTELNYCGGFFILKSNGKFMKYYGDDYFTEVENFLKEK